MTVTECAMLLPGQRHCHMKLCQDELEAVIYIRPYTLRNGFEQKYQEQALVSLRQLLSKQNMFC